MSIKQAVDNVMNTFKQEDKVMIEEGGKSVELFAREPKTWDISHETFTNVGGSGDNNIDLFLNKSQSIASNIPESYKESTRIAIDELEVSGKSSGQNISTLIDNFSSDVGGGETLLEGKTKTGQKYSFLLNHYVDEGTGEEFHTINGDKFDKDDYRTTIDNIHEKLDNVSLAVNEKFEKGGGDLSAQEYLSAAEQEPKVTVGKPSGGYWQPPPPK